MTIAEGFYNLLPDIQDEEDLLEIMDNVMEASISHDIAGDIAFFVFSDSSWLKTELQGDCLGSWHGIMKSKDKLH